MPAFLLHVFACIYFLLSACLSSGSILHSHMDIMRSPGLCRVELIPTRHFRRTHCKSIRYLLGIIKGFLKKLKARQLACSDRLVPLMV